MKKVLLGSACAVAMSATAHAQDGASPQSAGEAGDSDGNEIIVTAQKRAESLQDVPLAVTVISNDALVGGFFTDFTDLQKLASTVTFAEGSNAGTSSIQIRGIGTSVFDDAVEPTVSVIVDGVVLSRNIQGFVDLIDIERVEVLKGPQGTLFGKNASGGVINIVTKRPSDGFELEAEALYAELDEFQLRGTVSAPFGEGSGGFRLTGFYKTIDGNIANVLDERVFNGEESWGIRGKLEFEPTPQLNVYIIADYRHFDALASEETALIVGQDGLAAALAASGIVPGEENRLASTFAAIEETSEDYGISAQIDWDLGPVTLTSQTAWRRYTNVNSDDVDLLGNDPAAIGRGLVTNSTLGNFGGLFLAGPIDIIQTSDFELDQFTQELRLTSGPGPFEYLAGVFYAESNIDSDFTRTSDGCVAPVGVTLLPLVAGGPCAPNGIIPGTTLPDIIPLSDLLAATGQPPGFGRVIGDVETRNYAIFGQATVKLTDRLGVTGGLRLQHDEVEVFAFQADPSSAIALSAIPFEIQGDRGETAFSGRASIEYEFGNDNLAYFTYARGYKAPTIDFDPAGNQVDVEEETSNGFEIGLKSSFANDRVIFNIAGFFVEYNDLQEEAFDPTTGFFLLNNVGRVSTLGIEADFIARPVEGLSLTGSAAFIEAEIEEFPNGPCFVPATADPGCDLLTLTKDLEGFDLPNSPDFKFSFTADYETALGSDLLIGGRATVSYQDEVNFSLSGDPNTVQGAYALVDASLRVGSADERWILSVFVRNLFDKNYRTSLFQDFTSFVDAQTLQRIPLNAERRFGASLRFRY